VSGLVVVGAGGHGRVVAEAALLSGAFDKIVFFDDLYPDMPKVDGSPVLGRVEDLWAGYDDANHAAVAISDNRKRVELVERLRQSGFACPAIVHPAACVSRSANLADGVLVLAGAIVNVGASLGEGAIANTGCTIDHECILERGVHVSPGANLAGGVRVGEFGWIGIGATVNHGVTIGAGAVVGASAGVIRDVPAGTTVVGLPAKAIDP
jgi:sugar O-acyltransferase (sialic acid O-acetyltransferase NeuD family)